MLMAGDVPVPLVIEAMVSQSCPKGTVMRPDGTLKSGAEAERFEDEVHLEEYGEERVQLQEEASNLRRGKRCKVANKHYMCFWRHDDNETSDEDLQLRDVATYLFSLTIFAILFQMAANSVNFLIYRRSSRTAYMHWNREDGNGVISAENPNFSTS